MCIHFAKAIENTPTNNTSYFQIQYKWCVTRACFVCVCACAHYALVGWYTRGEIGRPLAWQWLVCASKMTNFIRYIMASSYLIISFVVEKLSIFEIRQSLNFNLRRFLIHIMCPQWELAIKWNVSGGVLCRSRSHSVQ